MAVTDRMKRVAGASAVGQALAVITQIVLVPIFLHAWGVERYGDWLLLSTVPAYLATSDLGFLSASSNRMASLRAAGRDAQAVKAFHLAWALASASGACVLVLSVVTTSAFNVSQLLNLRSISDHDAAMVVILLAAFTALAQFETVVQGAFRAEALTTRGTYLSIASRNLGVAAAAVAAVATRDLVVAATAMLTSKALLLAVEAAVLRWSSQIFRFGVRWDWSDVRTLLRPSVAFLGLPLGNAITLQVFLVVLGHEVGAHELVAFALVRTLSRFGTQLVGVVEFAIWPELSYAFGRGDVSLMRRLHGKACSLSFYLAVAAGAALSAFALPILHVWTSNQVHIPFAVVAGLSIDLVATALWSTSAVLPAATNQGLGRVTAAYIACGGLSVLLLPALTAGFRLAGAPMGMILCDVLMIPVVLTNSLRLLGESRKEFYKQMLPAAFRPQKQTAST
jgi:O-antigen/teichoic acid export membrane protein